MRSSYNVDDVVLLLKDITGLVSPQPAAEREKLIQAGRHYCEMLPLEYVPTQAYLQAYEEALEIYGGTVSKAVENLADLILERKGENTVLVSLARAGIPAGILLKRYIKRKYHLTLPHYAVSIIRGRGIDHNAMKYLLKRYAPQQLLFVDGWTGKGAILRELKKAAAGYEGVSADLAVLADPPGITDLCGTHEDILIPSSCLNSTVSGLFSRTFLRDDIIGADDFHGAVYYEEFEQLDLSYEFIEAIEAHFGDDTGCGNLQKDAGKRDFKPLAASGSCSGCRAADGMEEALQIAEALDVSDINFIKPGIGETTRVLLRRVPWKVLIDPRYKDSRELRHMIRLAEEKNVSLEEYPLVHYKCCGIIKKIADT